MKLLSKGKGILTALLDFVFPPRCPICQAYVENQGECCTVCKERVLRIRRLPLYQDKQQYLDGVWAIAVYRGGMQKMILGVKYYKKKQYVPYIQNILLTIDELLPVEITQVTIAVPVPLFREKEKKRGFNQVTLFFRSWAAAREIDFRILLQRIRSTKPQYDLGLLERAANVKDAFCLCVPGMRLDGQSIVLLDDIVTTGATLRECAAVLKRAGAARVWALVLASDCDR